MIEVGFVRSDVDGIIRAYKERSVELSKRKWCAWMEGRGETF